MACASESEDEWKKFFETASEYARSLNHEAQSRYVSKLKYNRNTMQLPDPYSIKNGWTDDPTSWPDVTFGDIYSYLIEVPGAYSKESLKAYKSLEAYDFFVAGHVKPVAYHPISEESPYCFLKARIIPSQRVRNKPHDAWVCCVKTTGSIYCAHCTCMAG